MASLMTTLGQDFGLSHPQNFLNRGMMAPYWLTNTTVSSNSSRSQEVSNPSTVQAHSCIPAAVLRIRVHAAMSAGFTWGQELQKHQLCQSFKLFMWEKCQTPCSVHWTHSTYSYLLFGYTISSSALMKRLEMLLKFQSYIFLYEMFKCNGENKLTESVLSHNLHSKNMGITISRWALPGTH